MNKNDIFKANEIDKIKDMIIRAPYNCVKLPTLDAIKYLLMPDIKEDYVYVFFDGSVDVVRTEKSLSEPDLKNIVPDVDGAVALYNQIPNVRFWPNLKLVKKSASPFFIWNK